MKISEVKDEAALDLLAEILEPAAMIIGDKEIAEILKNGKPTDAIKLMIKNHKSEVIEIMAAMDGVPKEEYHCNVFTLPIKLLEILNDKELMQFFISQSQKTFVNASGSAMGNTEEQEK